MRFMILVRCAPGPAALAAYHGELARAGVLLDGAALAPAHQAWCVRGLDGAPRHCQDGPCGGDLPLAGYALIQVRSRAEALEWSRRFPAPAELEVRALAAP